MKIALKVIVGILITPVLILGLYIFFLWASYIDNTVVEGSKYGFTIDSTKEQVYQGILQVNKKYPQSMVYVSYGPTVGEHKELPITKDTFHKINMLDFWTLLLDGEGEYFNVIKLKFDNDKLIRIHRHRKYFELP